VEKAKIGKERDTLIFKERIFIVEEVEVKTASFLDYTPYNETLNVEVLKTPIEALTTPIEALKTPVTETFATHPSPNALSFM
jgi:hypothetical protein